MSTTPVGHSLRRRIALAFVGLALLIGFAGGFLAVLFAYTAEDHIFDRLLALEIEHLDSTGSGAGPLPQPALPFASYHEDDALPAQLRGPIEAEPGRREIFGDDGQHYHLVRHEPAGRTAPVWVVLQVEDYLAVRPIFSGILAFLAATVLLFVLGAGLAGLLFAHRVTAPLRALAAEADALEPGALPERWTTRVPEDEVGTLAAALLGAFRRIADFIDREQRFTQDASHELRTPLAVIDSSATLLARGEHADSDAALIARIRSASLAMQQSVDALLALAREDSPEGSRPHTAVLPIVERTIVNHANLLEGKPVEVTVTVGGDWRVAGDPAALQVLVANLVSNAFRYTPNGEVRIEQDGDDLLVIDSGAGVEETIRADVRRPAVKGSDSPGLGLGLAIVDRICERHGWRFDLVSGAEGTTARLSLR